MPIGGRADHIGAGWAGIPGTLLDTPAAESLGSPQPGIVTPSVRRFSVNPTRTVATDVLGASTAIASIAGPGTGFWTIERLVIVANGVTVAVLVGPAGDWTPARVVDVWLTPGSTYLLQSDPQPIRVLPGEDLHVLWDASGPPPSSTWSATLQVAVS